MNHTENYHLPRWDMADRIQMADFNSMTGAIEDALTGHDGRMDGQDAALAAQSARMDRLGNCQIYHGTYTGNSSASSKTLSFPHKPIFVMVLDNSAGFLLSVQGLDRARLSLGGTNYTTLCTWSGNSFSWDADVYKYFTESGRTYYVVAFLDAAE